VGIIGLGHVFGWQRSALDALTDLELTAVCDRDPAKCPDDTAVEFVPDLDRLVARPDLDLLVVSVPPSAHFDVARTCLESGKHVLLEKPATETLRELESLYEIADRHDRRLVVGFHAAFGRELLWLLRMPQAEGDRRWGPLTGFDCDLRDPYCDGLRLAERARGLGGSWMDAGINGLSVIACLVAGLSVESASFVHGETLPAVDVRSKVRFDFTGPRTSAGAGVVGVDWRLGMDRKRTTLDYASSGYSVLLDHSAQQVVEHDPSGESRILADLSDRHPRLTEHYIGVFENLVEHLENKSDNRAEALKLHALLFDALQNLGDDDRS